mgnify:CR=1 FL=1
MYLDREYQPRRRRPGFFGRFWPLLLLVAVAIVFNLTAVGDSAIHSATLTEVVPPAHLATAYSVRSILGFGMGVASPWLFGVVLDVAGGTPAAWGWAWTMLGALALLGPWATWKLQSGRKQEHALPERAQPGAPITGLPST